MKTIEDEPKRFDNHIDLKLVPTVKMILLTSILCVLTACKDDGNTSSSTKLAKPMPIQSYQDNFGSIQSNQSTATATDDNTPTLNLAKNLTGVKLYLDGQLVESTYKATLGTVVANAPVTVGKHEFTYTVFSTVSDESPKSDCSGIINLDSC